MKKQLYVFFATCIVFSLLFAAGDSSFPVRGYEGEQYNYINLPVINNSIYIKGTDACFEGFVNGTFESSSGWQIPITEYTAGYSTARSYTGSRSMRTGITVSGDNTYSYSDARQVVTLPSDAVSVRLTMWLYPTSSDTSKEIVPELQPGDLFGETALVGDMQYILVLDRYYRILQTLLWQRSNASTWTQVSYDLTKYRGQTIMIQFGTYNDGLGGITSMFVDDGSLEICYAPAATATPTGTPATATPTNTPTNTPTPTIPAGCYEAVGNGGFENFTSWYIPITEYTASYSASEVHSGSRSLRTGITFPLDNRYSFSSGMQTITIPSGITSATFSFWIFPMSTETVTTQAESSIEIGQTFTEELLAYDRQYVLILDSANKVLAKPVDQKTNTRIWEKRTVNLTGFAGQPIKLYFDTYNDGYGGITAMYVDDVSLMICPQGGVVPTPTSTPSPTATSTPSAACYTLTTNPSFESSSGWQIPLTTYLASYSTAQARTGTRSMRTGITLPADNRYSYSDAYQVVSVPPNATSAVLRFSTYSLSGEVMEKSLPETLEGSTFGLQTLAGDVQYFLILDRYGTWIDTLLWQRVNNPSWVTTTVDLRAYRGWTIRLQFGTYNDGWGGNTAMYVDDVNFEICP